MNGVLEKFGLAPFPHWFRDTELCAALRDGKHLVEKYGDADTAHFVRPTPPRQAHPRKGSE